MLGNFKYNVQYWQSRVNKNADCSSRVPVALVQTGPENSDDILREQNHDPLYWNIRSYMED